MGNQFFQSGAGTVTYYGSDTYTNGIISLSVGAGALTIALKTKAGTNPSTSDPVTVGFRNATATDGGFVIRTVTSALSLVVSSGSTLGQRTDQETPIYFYLMDNAGTVELAVSSTLFDESFFISSTTEGGAGASDSASTLYSTTGRSGIAIRVIGRWSSSQATAGTWASTSGTLNGPPFDNNDVRANAVWDEVYLDTGASFGTVNTMIRNFTTIRVQTGQMGATLSATLGAAVFIPKTDWYYCRASDQDSAGSCQVGISINGTTLTQTIAALTYAQGKRVAATLNGVGVMVAGDLLYLNAGDIVRHHDEGGNDLTDLNCNLHVIRARRV